MDVAAAADATALAATVDVVAAAVNGYAAACGDGGVSCDATVMVGGAAGAEVATDAGNMQAQHLL
jgi:hypothetical protein